MGEKSVGIVTMERTVTVCGGGREGQWGDTIGGRGKAKLDGGSHFRGGVMGPVEPRLATIG